jgi:prolyl-tRNA synthetase
MSNNKGIPARAENYSEWYNELVKKADLAEHSAVKGCMVIKPYGYAIWEKMQAQLDKMFKDTGHSNAYFPLFVPKSFLEKEEGHAEGFAKECAVVTHYRLKADPNEKGRLIADPDSRLDEELIVRPTSEAVIWNTYRNWIQSYRDLPLLINQWANVVRWEMRTRLFLRTTEFLWQEGHTAHATKAEAIEETERMLHVYAEFAEKHLAVPVIRGIKTENEKFAGAETTYCIEALMQNGWALQAGTSHFLGQNFAKAFEVRFTTREGTQDLVWGTSWGVSTRLMGALIMAHSDDEGLVLPPGLAPIQVVLVPIYRSDDELARVSAKALEIKAELQKMGISVRYDDRDTLRPGFKFAEWELKGVPVRLALGPKDLDNGTIEVARRDLKTKEIVPLASVAQHVPTLLAAIHDQIYGKALAYRDSHITAVNSYDEFKQVLETKGGFIAAHWDGDFATADRIKDQTKATIRCIPLGNSAEAGQCMVTGRPSQQRVLFARAY